MLMEKYGKNCNTQYTLDLQYAPFESMDDKEFYLFCEQNKHIPIERDENHQIFFLPLITNYISIKNADLTADIGIWNRKLKAGLVFESSAGFYLPDTSMRSPDAAWISYERWNALTENQRKGFAYIAPDFVVELASPSDSLSALKTKMEKWRDNGVRLSWLIDPTTETVFIYRIDGTISKIEGFDNILSGENVLFGFEFGLAIIR